jgi:hypothetical protein
MNNQYASLKLNEEVGIAFPLLPEGDEALGLSSRYAILG